jgi:hypothetical protein
LNGYPKLIINTKNRVSYNLLRITYIFGIKLAKHVITYY